MKSLTIKGLPEPLYRALKRRAREHRRSLNAEVIVCLEDVVLGPALSGPEILARADAVRESIHGVYLTDEEIDRSKRAGRP